jgi:hypothetical protein
MQKLDQVWLAATLDAEGSLGLYSQKQVGTEYKRYIPMICLVNTYLPLIERFQQLTSAPEAIHKRIATTSHIGKKTVYSLNIRNRAILINVLSEISPYMMEKKELAEALIEYLTWFGENRANSRQFSPSQKRLMRAEYDDKAELVRSKMSRAIK